MVIKNHIVKTLKQYDKGAFFHHVNSCILPEYQDEKGHDIKHIVEVLHRIFALNHNLKLNLDPKLFSTATFYHDIGRKINDDTHEIISAKIFMSDQTILKFFTISEQKIIKEAIEDHRASSTKPARNIYGKLLSSADRNTSIAQVLRRTYEYRLLKSPDLSLDAIIQDSREHLLKKFGMNGYANGVYFDDGVYKKFLEDLQELLSRPEEFKTEYLKTNNLS